VCVCVCCEEEKKREKKEKKKERMWPRVRRRMEGNEGERRTGARRRDATGGRR